MKKSAIVTMFFDLSKLEDANPATRPMSFYLEKGIGTLQLKYPMVIFCDKTTKPLIKEIRDRLVDPKKIQTVYIEKNISEYEMYELNWETIKNNRSNIERYHKPDERNTPSQFITVMFKPLALQIANTRNDFNVTHYAWIDFGCSHVIERFKDDKVQIGQDMIGSCSKMLDSPHDKISMLYIHYRSKEELEDMNYFTNNGFCSIAATTFTLEKKYVSKFYNATFSIFNEQILKGCGHTEETIMAYCYNRYPELFNIYYGDYYSVTKNYHYVTQDYPCIKYHFINNCIKKKRIDLAKKAAETVRGSVQKGFLNLPEKELGFLEEIISL